MKNHCGESAGFSFRTALWFLAASDFVYAKFSEINVICKFDLLAIFTVKCNDSVSLSFLSRCVFELSVPCVCLFHCVLATEFDYIEFSTTASDFYCMQLIV